MIFQNGDILVRNLKNEDVEVLAKWLSDSNLLEYYEGRDNPFDTEKVKEKFYNRTNGETGCIVEYEGIPIGYIQFYELDDQAKKDYGYGHSRQILYGTDQFIGELDYWNRGIGKQLVISMVEYLIKIKRADKVVMNPQTWNIRSIHCYEKCGFKKVKLLPKYEYHEGEYRDCWVMEYSHVK